MSFFSSICSPIVLFSSSYVRNILAASPNGLATSWILLEIVPPAKSLIEMRFKNVSHIEGGFSSMKAVGFKID